MTGSTICVLPNFERLDATKSRSGLTISGTRTPCWSGRPAMLALDVFDSVPPTDPADPIVSHLRVIGTPHIGDVTEDDTHLTDIYDKINT